MSVQRQRSEALRAEAPVVQHVRAEDHLGLAKATAGRFARTHPRIGYSEFLSAAYLGLVQAGARFDPSRGVQFSTWATTYIQSACVEVLRAEAHYRGWIGRGARGAQRAQFQSFEALTVPLPQLRVPPNQEAWVDREDALWRVHEVWQAQPPRTRRLLQLIAAGATVQAAGMALGFSKNWGGLELKKARERAGRRRPSGEQRQETA